MEENPPLPRSKLFQFRNFKLFDKDLRSSEDTLLQDLNQLIRWCSRGEKKM
jgi:hypothetical protein